VARKSNRELSYSERLLQTIIYSATTIAITMNAPTTRRTAAPTPTVGFLFRIPTLAPVPLPQYVSPTYIHPTTYNHSAPAPTLHQVHKINAGPIVGGTVAILVVAIFVACYRLEAHVRKYVFHCDRQPHKDGDESLHRATHMPLLIFYIFVTYADPTTNLQRQGPQQSSPAEEMLPFPKPPHRKSLQLQ
jgi:hypothetical protein